MYSYNVLYKSQTNIKPYDWPFMPYMDTLSTNPPMLKITWSAIKTKQKMPSRIYLHVCANLRLKITLVMQNTLVYTYWPILDKKSEC